MADLPPAHAVLTTAPDACYDLVVLGYDERLLRRKRLVTVHGEGFLVDLPAVTNMDDHWGFCWKMAAPFRWWPPRSIWCKSPGRT